MKPSRKQLSTLVDCAGVMLVLAMIALALWLINGCSNYAQERDAIDNAAMKIEREKLYLKP